MTPLVVSTRLRCVYDVIDMPYDWPAEVNYHEAKAFAAWKGPEYRLPIEAECNAIRGYQVHYFVELCLIFIIWLAVLYS